MTQTGITYWGGGSSGLMSIFSGCPENETTKLEYTWEKFPLGQQSIQNTKIHPYSIIEHMTCLYIPYTFTTVIPQSPNPMQNNN